MADLSEERRSYWRRRVALVGQLPDKRLYVTQDEFDELEATAPAPPPEVYQPADDTRPVTGVPTFFGWPIVVDPEKAAEQHERLYPPVEADADLLRAVEHAFDMNNPYLSPEQALADLGALGYVVVKKADPVTGRAPH